MMSQTINTFDGYARLNSGDVAPDGMIFVGVYEEPTTGVDKRLLRTEFNRMRHQAARNQVMSDNIHGHSAGVCHLPKTAEANLIREHLPKQDRIPVQFLLEDGDAFQIDGVYCDVVRGLNMATGKQETRPAGDLVSVCFVRSITL